MEIIEPLFGEVASEHWDALLDLRGLVLSGSDWGLALEVFLDCRERLEGDHYLPMYRLRRLVGSSLRFERAGLGGREVPALDCLLRAPALSSRHRLSEFTRSGEAFKLVEAVPASSLA